MNTNGTNPGMNVEDYEAMAVQKSNVEKRVAAGAAVFAGGAAVAGGAAYAATQTGEDAIDETLTTDDLVGGAEGAEEYKPQMQETHTTEKAIVRDPVKPEVPEEPKEPEMTWDETTNVYVDDEKTQRLTSTKPNPKNKIMQLAMGVPEDKYIGDVKYVTIDRSPGRKKPNPNPRLNTKEQEALEKKLEALHQEADKVNHPKSWFAKKIAWLRGLYTNLLHRMDKIAHTKLKNKTTMGVIKKSLAAMASSVMHLIDRFMNKLQLMSD